MPSIQRDANGLRTDTDGFKSGDLVSVDYGYGDEPRLATISGFSWYGDKVIARLWDGVRGSRQWEVSTEFLTKVDPSTQQS